MSARIAIAATVDVLVLGASAGAVAAAVVAARAGASVLVVAATGYLGEDVGGFLRLWPRRRAQGALARAAFIPGVDLAPRPLHVKRTLEDACLAAGVDLLYGALPAGVVRDAQGRICGAVIADRAGRQAVLAPRIIDGSHRAIFARQCRAACKSWPASGILRFSRSLSGAADLRFTGCTAEDEPLPVAWDVMHPRPVTVHAMECAVADGTPAALAAAETAIRRRTWDPSLLIASDRAWYLPPDGLAAGPHHAARLDDPAGLDLRCLAVPATDDGGGAVVHVLGPCADLGAGAAAAISDPVLAMAVGERLGVELAAASRAQPRPAPVAAGLDGGGPGDADAVRGSTAGLRATERGLPEVALDDSRLPVLAEVDVLVVGGGTGGAPAAIAAARAGARTLLIEQLAHLGGVGTLGMIGRYWHGNRVGFTAEVDAGVAAMGAKPRYANSGAWVIPWKQHWWLESLARAGGDVWFGAQACAALMAKGAVRGALVATRDGAGLVRARTLVDASGNADLAGHAGAAVVNIGSEHVAVQGTGLPPVNPGVDYQNSDHTFVDDTDQRDSTRAHIVAKRRFPAAWDAGQLIDTRQRQQIAGAASLSPLDILADRQVPDAICRATSNFDSHGFTVHPVFVVKPPDKQPLWAWIPFRALLPLRVSDGGVLDGLLVIGLGMSAHRDALPVVRMQADVQNTGYAAGVAAALAAQRGCALEGLDLRELQRHLVAKGNLPESALAMGDSFPLPASELERLIGARLGEHAGIAAALAHPEAARPLVRRWLDDPQHGETAALILALLGDPAGGPLLRSLLSDATWDPGWNFRGMGQMGMSMSRVDSRLVALGHLADPADATLIARHAAALDDCAAFSHLRAVAWAGALVAPGAGDGPVARELARLLGEPGMAGHAITDLAAACADSEADLHANRARDRSLKELHLAVGLWRCGDRDGLARGILETYVRDLRGHYSRHASAVLTGMPATARR